MSRDVLGSVIVSMAADVGKLVRDFDKAKKELNDFERTAKSFAATVGGAFAAAFGTQQAVDFGRAVTEAGLAAERADRAFNSITGSSRETAREMEWLRSVADELGQNFFVLRDSYRGVLAGFQGTAMEGEQTRELFVAVTAASAALGLTTEDTKGTFRAFIQTMSKGKVQAEELRGQLGERLYGAFNKAADAMGVSTERLNKMLERGEVLAEDLLPRMTEVLEEEFGPTARAMTDSATAAVNKMNEAWQDFKETIADAGFLDAVTVALNTLSQTLDHISSTIVGPTIAERLADARRRLEEERAAQEAASGVSASVSPTLSELRARRQAREQGNMRTLPVPGVADTSGVSGQSSRIANLELEVLRLEDLQRFEHLERMREQREATAKRAEKEAAKARRKAKAEAEAVAKERQEAFAEAEEDAEKFARSADRIRRKNADFAIAEIERERDAILARLSSTSEERVEVERTAALFIKEIRDKEAQEEQDRLDDLAEERDKRARAQLEVRRGFYDELAELTLSDYEYQVRLINEQAEVFLAAGVKEVDVVRWKAERIMEASEEAYDGARRAVKDYVDAATNAGAQVEDALTSAAHGFEDAWVNALMTGKFEFSSFANSVIADLARMAVQQGVTGPLMSAIGGMFPARASGGPVFGGGAYLVGENGPEIAVMPTGGRILSHRDSMAAVGGAAAPSSPNVNVNIIGAPQQPRVQSRRGSDGGLRVDVLFDRTEASLAGRVREGSGPLAEAAGSPASRAVL